MSEIKFRTNLDTSNFDDVDYRIENPYEEHSSCGSICRCGRIEDVVVKPSINDLNSSLLVIPEGLVITEKDEEYINTLMIHHGLGDGDAYYADIDDSYYGQIISAICIHNTDDVEKNINILMSLDSDEAKDLFVESVINPIQDKKNKFKM